LQHKLRSQSQVEIAAMVASAELYGEFQVSWRSEMLASYSAHLQENDNDNGVRLSAIESDLAWAQKVAAARNAYFAALGTATSEYNNSVIDALEAYNETVLGAEITRTKAYFNAAESYSKGSYDIEADYARAVLATDKKTTLAYLDAAIAQMVGLAGWDTYFARKIADEYSTITVDDDFGAVRNQIDDDNYLASNQKRQEINDTKTATDNASYRQAQRDNNDNYIEYFEAWLALQTTYEIAIATANETYYNTIIVANTTYNETVTMAEKKYDEDYCRLTGQYYDTLLAIDTNGTVNGNFYNNGTSSLNVQVCFPAGTPVILADGTTKNIEDILPGDLVKTVDHQKPDGTITEGRVIRVFKNDPQPLWRLNFGTFEIRATKEHPFYVKGKGWVTAEDLQIGDVCRSVSDTEITLIAKEYETDKVPVFNFEVENAHTYFIGNNATQSTLVHNDCEWHHLLPGGNDLDKLFADAEIDNAMRNSKEYGYFLDAVQHRGTGESIHSKKWNQTWLDWFNTVNKPTKADVMVQLEKMMADNAFKALFETGNPATVDYSTWKGLSTEDKAKTFEKARKNAANIVAQNTKPVNTGLRMVNIGEEVVEQPSRYKQIGRVLKKAGKAAPVIGTVVTIACWGCDVYGKGPVYGTANSTIDAIPVVGTIKGIVEIFTGDFIPDKESNE
jgi:hypothetical protein